MNLEEVKNQAVALVDGLVVMEEQIIALVRQVYSLQYTANVLQETIKAAEVDGHE